MTTPTTRRRASRVEPAEFREATQAPPFDTDETGEQTPAPRRRRAQQEESELEVAPAPRRRQQVDDEPVGEDTGIPYARGRKEIKSSRPQSEASLMYFRWGDDGDPQLVKFFDEEPWAYNQHWVSREGRQSFPCLNRPGHTCPLCEVGVKVSQRIVYSMINITHQEGPTVQVLEVGPTLDETLAAYDDDRKTGPLNRLWWSLSRTKGARSSNTRAKYNYLISAVKDRDLEEDWGLDLDDVESKIKGLKSLDPTDVLGKVDKNVLQEVADEIMGR